MCNQEQKNTDETKQEMMDRAEKIKMNNRIEEGQNRLEAIRNEESLKGLLGKIEEIKESNYNEEQIRKELETFASVINKTDTSLLVLATTDDEMTATIIETMLELKKKIVRKP